MADKEPTRADLAEALARATALIEEQGAAIAELRAARPAADSAIQLELVKAINELKASTEAQNQARARPGAFYTGPDKELTPYAGYVVSTAICCVDHRREEGEVFQVSVAALWSDDPFVPVTITGQKDDGTLTWEPNKSAPTPINFRFRKQVSAAEDPTLRRASEY